MSRPLRVALIASSRFPIAEPFVGGLEAHVWQLARSLRERGVHVAVFAAPGSDTAISDEELRVPPLLLSSAARADVAMPPDVVMAEHHAYLSLMLGLAGDRSGDFDVIHNHSLHYLPLAMASSLSTPMITTLHTPPTPWLESAMQTAPSQSGTFVAVSAHTAASWEHAIDGIQVVRNGVDLDRWRTGPGGESAIWFGRIVPEKGTHHALAAARLAGLPIQIAGPIVDRPYFDSQVAPLLTGDATYIGHLDQRELSAAVGRARVALVTPCWDEPYGLVVAEALACGTPVAAFARGGVPEIVDPSCAVLAAPDDVPALAAAAIAAAQLSRADARARAEAHCSVQQMVERYLEVYDDVVGQAA